MIHQNNINPHFEISRTNNDGDLSKDRWCTQTHNGHTCMRNGISCASIIHKAATCLNRNWYQDEWLVYKLGTSFHWKIANNWKCKQHTPTHTNALIGGQCQRKKSKDTTVSLECYTSRLILIQWYLDSVCHIQCAEESSCIFALDSCGYSVLWKNNGHERAWRKD